MLPTDLSASIRYPSVWQNSLNSADWYIYFDLAVNDWAIWLQIRMCEEEFWHVGCQPWDKFWLGEHGVYLSWGKVREKMSTDKTAVTHAVMRKGDNYELQAWVMRCAGHDVMLICWILMCASKSASLADTMRSSCIFVRVISTNCILLVPLHSSVTRMSCGRMNILV